MEPTGQLSCFVICPIGDKHAEIDSPRRTIWERNIIVWEEVIFPACCGVGLNAIRADQISEAGEITDQIFRHLRDSHIVIADLTDANPNVMYELGLRHTTGKLTVHIGETGLLPFDIASIRTIQFQRTSGGFISARRSLVETLASGIEGRFTPTSATRVWLEQQSTPDDFSNIPDPGRYEEDGYLEKLADLDIGRSEMTSTLQAMGNVIGEITESTAAAKAEIEKAGGPSASFEKKIVISKSLAEKISDPADRLEALAAAFVDSISKSDPGNRFLIEHLKGNIEDGENRANLKSLVDFFEVILKGLDSAKVYRDSLQGEMPTRAQGVQYRRISAALDRQVATRPIVEGWVEAAR